MSHDFPCVPSRAWCVYIYTCRCVWEALWPGGRRLRYVSEARDGFGCNYTIEIFYMPPASHLSLLHPDDRDDDPMFYVESVCSSFLYNIPSFDVMSVSLRHLKVKGWDENGKETPYDLFIRNDESQFPELPALIAVRDSTIVKVREL